MVNVQKNLTGETFGLWTVLFQADDYIDNKGKHYAKWMCECQCEQKTIRSVLGKDLKQGKSTNCGCLQKNKLKQLGHLNKKYNTYDLINHDYGIGYTSKNEEFYFDLEDYDKIKNYCWHYTSENYIGTNSSYDENGKRRTIFMHNIILNTDFIPDHKNGVKHDNRKENLRISNFTQNRINHKLASNNTSGVTGVNWDKKSQKWHVRITVNHKQISLGFFNDFNEAVKVREDAENKYYGIWSYKNSQEDSTYVRK